MTRIAACRGVAHRVVAIGAGAVVLSASGPARAQRAAPRLARLGTATGELSAELAGINSVRELADGRVLVASAFEPRLVVANFRGQTVAPVSREGDGPGEYREVSRIHALAGDTTLVEDRRGPRWILLEGTHAVATLQTWTAGWRGPVVGGVDHRGRVLEVRPFRFGRSPGAPAYQFFADAESVTVLVHAAGTLTPDRGARHGVDTIARLAGPWRGLSRGVRGTANGAPLGFELRCPLASSEQAVIFADGWIAIALHSPYRVDWVPPAGIRQSGKPLPFPEVRVDDLQKANAMQVYEPAITRAGFTPSELPGWPDVLPAFPNDALLAVPDGRLLIRRTSNALVVGTFYDVVGRDGSLAGQRRLEANERIVGFGPNTVYVAVRADDDTELLRRYPWP